MNLPAPLLYQLATPPAAAAVDLDQVRRHLRIEAEDTDEVEAALLEASIAAAVGHVDGRTGVLNRCLITQTWQTIADRPAWNVVGPCSGFVVDLAPLQAVVAIEARQDGAYVALPEAKWRTLPLPGGRAAVVTADAGAAWPVADADPAAWRLTLRAGYGDAPADVPAPIRAALLLMIADLYDNRDGKVVANLVANPTIDRLLAPYRRLGV